MATQSSYSQWNVLEAKYAFRVVIRQENSIHFANSDLKANTVSYGFHDVRDQKQGRNALELEHA
jgi:hypothetical protein